MRMSSYSPLPVSVVVALLLLGSACVSADDSVTGSGNAGSGETEESISSAVDDTVDDSVVIVGEPTPGEIPTPAPTSAYTGPVSQEELTGLPSPWASEHVDLVEFVEETTGFEFRHRFHIVDAPGQQWPNDDLSEYPQEILEAFSAVDDVHRALGLTNEDFETTPPFATQHSGAWFDESSRQINVSVPLSAPITRDTAIVQALTLANQWGNRLTHRMNSVDSGGLTAVSGEVRFVVQQFLADQPPAGQQDWWELYDAQRSPYSVGLLGEAQIAIGAAYFEFRHTADGSIADLNQRPPGTTDALATLLYPNQPVPDAPRDTFHPVEVPARARGLFALNAVSVAELLVALARPGQEEAAHHAVSEVGSTSSRAWILEDDTVCVGVNLDSRDGIEFDQLPALVTAWAAKQPEHRSVQQPDAFTLQVSGCDPGVGNVVDPSLYRTTESAAFTAPFLTRVQSWALLTSPGEDQQQCLIRAVLNDPTQATLDSPWLRAPLAEWDEHLPASCR